MREIRTERDYKRALKAIADLWKSHEPDAMDQVEDLMEMVEEYELSVDRVCKDDDEDREW